MYYTFNQLSIFLKVADTGSITKAAELLNLTQPAVSIQLKNFQKQFKQPLIELVGKKIYITDFGKEIVLAAGRILKEVETLEYKAAGLSGRLAGKLKISVVSTGKYVIPYFLSGFLKIHPEVELELDVSNKNQVLENLERNEVDFTLVSVLPDHLFIKKMDLMPNKLFLMGANPPNPNTEILDYKDLESLQLIYREPGSATRKVMEQFTKTKKIKVKKQLELKSNEAVKQAVIAGLGYSILPLIGAKNEIANKQLHIIKTKGLPIVTHWNMVWLADKKLSPLAQAYLDYLKKEKNEIIQQHFQWINDY